MTLKRFSSRTHQLDQEFLAKVLHGASQYLRIAGYFRSSIFELVGEKIAQIAEVKIVCNSELDYADFQVSQRQRESFLKEKWNKIDLAAEALLKKERYQILDQLLSSGRVEIRVLPKERLFLHGKAGLISYPNGYKLSFVESVNESKSAFSQNYELIWQDDAKESAQWVEEEFWPLWNDGVPLPEAILLEIKRVANRKELRFEDFSKVTKNLPAAAMAEAPIYRGGEQLQPWQRSFVTMFLEHRELYGKARLLLADEVGVGKTLSMATSALISVLLNDGPVLILTPSTLTIQWQIELKDKLGIPSAVWSSKNKSWFGEEGQLLSPRNNADFIIKCPYQIAIISTGLIVQQRENNTFIKEAKDLLTNKYGSIILDEAHKARAKSGREESAGDPNNLLAFMLEIAKKTKHLILGTATFEQSEYLLKDMSAEEKECLNEIKKQLSRPEAKDSKLDTIKWFLKEFKSDGKTWHELGCIIFSQYFDTAEWIASELAKIFPNEVIALYAGAGKSGLFRNDQFNSTERETIKSAIKKREIKLLVATDAACEGLNLQTLGTLINVDLPWNPSKLEQRLGRIKRFGQARKFVNMLNLVYSDTQDEKIYAVLSERLKDAYDIFGSLPDTINDEWITTEEELKKRIDIYIHEREAAKNSFSVKYKKSLDPNAEKWECCAEVLSRKDIVKKLSDPW